MNSNLPEQIEELIARLRNNIRKYVVLRGICLVIAAGILIFWLTLAIDWAWFGLTRMEIPRSGRILFLLAGMGFLVVVLLRNLVWQLMAHLRTHGLALQLEKTFPELNDRLISIVDLQQSLNPEKEDLPPLTLAMHQRVLNEASTLVDKLDLKKVFNFRPLKNATLVAGVAVLSLAATAVASPETLSHWSNAYLKLSEDYWNRKCGLNAVILAQPGDRVVEFSDRKARHPAGRDLTIVARTIEGKQTPDQVMMQYRTKSGHRSRVMMIPSGEGEFRHTIGDLVEDVEFILTGGDFTSVIPYQVETLPEPAISSMKAVCQYPDYTGWNNPQIREPNEILISGTELAVPMETLLQLEGTSTSPLKGIEITGRDFVFQARLDQETGRLLMRCRYEDEQGIAWHEHEFSDSRQMITGAGFTIPLRVTQRVEKGTTPAGGETAEPDAASPKHNPLYDEDYVIVNRDDLLRIVLEDEYGIFNLDPIRLNLHGIVDEQPQIETRLYGIGRAVTRKAFLPFEGVVRDDYGLAEVAFEYRIDQLEPAVQKLERQPGGALQFAMSEAAETPREKLDLLPLELEVDQVLLVSFQATDQDHLNGPHVARGETYRLKIVSDEELLSLLHQDELNLRKRFEQLIEELTRARDDFHQSGEKQDEPELLADATQRTLNILRKDAVEADAIRMAFESIRLELVNNRVDTPQMRLRLEDKIIRPLEVEVGTAFRTLDEQYRDLDYELQNKRPAAELAAQCLTGTDQLLTTLRRILSEMQQLENFQEVVEMLKEIIEEEKKLKERTEAERKSKLIDLLN